ncbi:hypothetical protein [Roseateles oligotrophus]|uniref:Histidine kinase n=1 Tax=Roseateles oligotrophus TaxID=1769250 RepID=A0ABT2YIW4_9BURK|nr:hypothetical protein [Roseateles oligotrophus]MCV2369953.1 hypothetical protein [Roseateles oligotrophus]
MKMLAGWAHVWQSWRSMRGSELGCALLVAVYLGMESLGPMLDFGSGPDRWTALMLSTGKLMCQSLFVFLCWLPADRSDPADPRRTRCLLLAVLLGAAISSLLLRWLMPHILLLAPVAFACNICPAYDPSGASWLNGLGEALNAWIAGGLVVAAFEMLTRRRRSDAALQALLNEQSRCAREAMAARLAAKQAQLEPQALFDSLLAIEQAYARGDGQAPTQMDGLIAQLRAAMGGGRR